MSEKPNMADSYKALLLDIIRKHAPHCKVYLFGSRARGTHRSGSDIDLALDAGQKLDAYAKACILEDIEDSVVPFFVDVIDLHDVSKDFRNFIIKDMVPWNV